jgi:hybrid cluster-associated redox disulfide protein
MTRKGLVMERRKMNSGKRGSLEEKGMLEGKRKIHKDMNIGEVLDLHPEAQKVFRKHFGEGCFNCSGCRVESIYFGALMHNKDANAIVEDLNAEIKF